jgi:hypothetical protein
MNQGETVAKHQRNIPLTECPSISHQQQWCRP